MTVGPDQGPAAAPLGDLSATTPDVARALRFVGWALATWMFIR